MALLFVDGFGKYGQNGFQFSGVQTTFNTGYELAGGGSIVFTDGFDVGNKALMISGSAQLPRIRKRITTTADTVIIGFEMRSTVRFSFFSIENVVTIDWPGAMEIDGNVGTAIPILNTGYYVELKLTKSTQAYTMRLNGYPYINGTLTNTIPDELVLQWGFSSVASGNFTFSNIVVLDNSGTKYTDFIGPQTIREDRPTASVQPVSWTPVPPSLTNVQIMQNIPPLASQYTRSDLANSSDYYTSSVPVTGDVTAVAVSAIVGKTDIDSHEVKIGIGPLSGRKEGVARVVQVQPAYLLDIFETDASNNDWTAASATNTEFGITLQPRP